MKKNFTRITLTLMLGFFSLTAAAATGWYEDYVKINVNNAGLTGPTGYYWIGTNPSWATSFVNGLGTVTSLKLDGADMKYWSDTQDRTGGSFFYQVTSADGLTTYIAATEAIWTQSYLGGNNYQGMSSGLNVDLLAGIPAGTACKLTVWAKSWGTGQGDSWLTNNGANYVATFTKGSVAIYGASGITNGTSYTTLKGAFDAINANASGLSTDNIQVRISDNTTETATAALNPSKGVNTITTAAGTGYVAPVITLTGGTTSAAGSLTVVITNGSITSITMTGGTWTAAPTVSIAAPAGGGTTATATASGTSGNQTFTITNGGTNYGPSASFSGGGGTGAAVNVVMTTAATAISGAASPRTATFAGVGLTYSVSCPGSGYTSNPTCAISSAAGGSGGTVTVASLYPSIEYNSLVVYPTVASKTISGSTASLISIVGRKKVTIDGRVNRTGTPTVGNASNLTLAVSGASNYLISMNSNCQNDTVQYCTLKGSATGSQGIIQFGSGASLANGNGLNVVDKNLITNNGTIPQYSVYSVGNSAAPNASNKITNNEFKDLIAYYSASNTIFLTGGVTSPTNDNFTISGNSFYTTANIPSNINSTRQAIAIGTSGNPYGGSHTITDNYIGGSAANCGGSALTKTGTNCSFNGILFYPSPSVTAGGVTATSIQNNTIKNISWTNSGFGNNCIMISAAGGTGAVNIGTVTGNWIGDNSSTGSIVISQSSSSASTIGINIATTGTVDCRNNKIGSITTSNVTAGFNSTTYAIQKTSTAGNVTISDNIIGSTTVANSISSTCPSLGTLTASLTNAVAGINCGGTGTNIMNNNTIANLTNTITGTVTSYGTGTGSPFSVTNNLFGITCGGTNGNNTINNNVINNLSVSVTDLMTANQYGIYLNGTTSTGNVTGNLIVGNSISGYNSTGGGMLIGIHSNVGTNTLTNNIVKLGDNNPVIIRGINDTPGSTIYHNTVYLTGTPTSGAFISSALYCLATTGRNYRNNILVNTRSNSVTASGEHYAFLTTSATATGITLDGNDYFVNGTNGMLGKIGTNASQNTIPFFTGQDASSKTVNPSFANAGGTLAVDYKPNNSLLAGVSGTGVTTDYAGATRSLPVIGAYESALAAITGAATTAAFTTTYGNASTAQTFSVSGTGLYANITATAPTGFEVSNGGAYGATTTFTQTNGSASGTLSIRLKADAAIGSYNSQSIVLSSTGATSVNITTPASGNAVNAIIPTVTPTIGTYTYDGNPQGPTAATNSGSGTSYTFSYAGTGNTSYSASATRPTAAGTYTVTVTVAADGNYAQASSAATAFTILSPSTVSSDTNASALTLSSGTNLTVASGSTLTIDENTTVNSVTVAAGGKLTVNNSSMLNAAGGITLQNTASGTASFVDSRTADNPTAIAGTVEQAITGTDRNWYVAVPVTGRTASDITLSGASIVKRNEATVSWEPVSAGTALTAGVGYIAVASASGGNATWTLAGNLQSGKVEVNVTRSGASSAGFNLLGNPYPSYLNWEQVLNLNATNASTLQPTIWYRTATYNEGLSKYDYTFNTYNSVARIATPTSTTGYIPPMQAFWVRANSAGTVTFTNAMRSHGDGASNKLKAPAVNTQKIVRLQVANTASISDETVLHFDVNAQNSFDNYDSPKMFNNVASKPEIFTSAGAEKLVINGMNDIPYNTEIPLGFVTGQTGDFSISRTEFTNFNADTRILLKDALNPATEFELAEGVSYNFSAQPTTATTNRFSLVFRAPGVTTGIDKTSKLNTQVFVNAANQIVIIAPVKSNYAIYNAMGQLMENGVLNTERETRNTKLATGVYMVKVGNTNSTRVIIK